MKFAWAISATLLIAAAVAPVQGQQPSEESNVLWAHGAVNNGIPVLPAERLWMNADAADAEATDTANGPGYCPNTPGVTVPEVGLDPVCLVEQNAARTQEFSHTFTLIMTPSLAEAIQLDTTHDVEFNLYFGANSGACTGTYSITLEGDGVTVAATGEQPLAFDTGYVLHTSTATGVAEVPAGDLIWIIDVTCEGTALFLGVHEETGKSNIVLPIGVPPAEEPEPVETGNQSVGNQTAGNSTAGNETTEQPEPEDGEPEPETEEPTDDPGEGTNSTQDQPVQQDVDSKDTPGPALMLVLLAVGLAGWRRRN